MLKGGTNLEKEQRWEKEITNHKINTLPAVTKPRHFLFTGDLKVLWWKWPDLFSYQCLTSTRAPRRSPGLVRLRLLFQGDLEKFFVAELFHSVRKKEGGALGLLYSGNRCTDPRWKAIRIGNQTWPVNEALFIRDQNQNTSVSTTRLGQPEQNPDLVVVLAQVVVVGLLQVDFQVLKLGNLLCPKGKLS